MLDMNYSRVRWVPIEDIDLKSPLQLEVLCPCGKRFGTDTNELLWTSALTCPGCIDMIAHASLRFKVVRSGVQLTPRM